MQLQTTLLDKARQSQTLPELIAALFEVEAWDALDWHTGQDAEFDYPKNLA